MTDLKKWWEDNGKLAQFPAENLYREQGKPCGEFKRDDFRKLIKMYREDLTGIKFVSNPIKKKSKVTIIQAGCLHFPQHDEKFISCLLQVAKYINPDYGVLSGDIADCSKHSNHNTDLGVLMLEAQKSRPTLRKFLTDFTDRCKKTIYIKGNHEGWIDDKKQLDISLLYDDDFTVPKVLGFDDLPIQYEPDLWEYQDFVFKHGESIAAGDNAPKMEFLGELRNGASSHTHRSGRYRHTTRTKQYVWYTTGCGCNLKMWYKLKGKSKINSGWNHSFNVFKFIGKQFQCTQVEVIDGQCIYNGKLFKGE